MHVVEIEFARTDAGPPADLDAVHGLLACWFKHGQLRSYPQAFLRRGSSVLVTAVVHTPDALDDGHANCWVRDEIVALRELGVTVRVTVVGEHAEGELRCTCEGRSGLILFSAYLSEASPLRCDDCFGEVPLHAVPTGESEEHLDLLHWRDDYQACDTLQMHCTVGERFGERQLIDIGGALSKEGRRLCAELEDRTGLPVFYVLSKSRGRSRESERGRPCPSCDGAWLLDEPAHDLFDFRCVPCRLLSNIAWSVR